ncbi:MAG TPA: threonine/serine dehydratase [Thermoanaerobaculia bacterium]|nr:threonine/serine dehydratase [Thermoanaerobaculia bacterium]
MEALFSDIEIARRRIAGIARPTPLVASPRLGETAGTSVHLKLENLQATGSFKVRGAASKILGLSPEERARGVITWSSGNHGLAVAYVARLQGIPATLCVPEWIDPFKHRLIRREGAEIVTCAGVDEAALRSEELREKRGATLIHAFDDPAVIAGQGTVGLEILESLPEVKTVVVPLSGGGLISGIALAVKEKGVRVVAAYAEKAPVMVESLKAGRPLSLPEEETLATALAGGIDLENRHTFQLVRRLVDDFVPVTEEDIADAMAFALDEHRLVLEGGGVVAVAAILASRLRSEGPVAAVVSGGNMALPKFLQAMETRERRAC